MARYAVAATGGAVAGAVLALVGEYWALLRYLRRHAGF